eukprot:4548556-Prymnesium_polylepis.1
MAAGFFERLVEHPIRLQLLLSQTRAGLWVRNGFAALKPATLYRSAPRRDPNCAPRSLPYPRRDAAKVAAVHLLAAGTRVGTRGRLTWRRARAAAARSSSAFGE